MRLDTSKTYGGVAFHQVRGHPVLRARALSSLLSGRETRPQLIQSNQFSRKFEKW